MALASLPPRKIALRWAEATGTFAAFVLRRERRRARANLDKVFGGEKSGDEIDRITSECFIHLAKHAADLSRFSKMPGTELELLVSCDDRSQFDSALARGKGLLGLSGHIGNWELMAAWFALKGYPIYAVGRKLRDARVNRLVTGIRENKGVKTIDRDQSALTLMRTLRQGKAVGVLIDQDTKVDSVVVDFFGHPARTPVGLARLAIRSRASVIPLGIHRRPDDGYHISIDPPVFPLSEDDRPSPEELTQRFNHALEKMILRDPAQWVWFHKRWRV